MTSQIIDAVKYGIIIIMDQERLPIKQTEILGLIDILSRKHLSKFDC